MLGVLHYNKWLIKKKSINHNLARYEVTNDKALNNCQKFQFGIKFLVISDSVDQIFYFVIINLTLMNLKFK